MASDRSTLEGKDRAELTVIAKTMGHKVGSRMRKAQIVDLIVGENDGASASDSTASSGRRLRERCSCSDVFPVHARGWAWRYAAESRSRLT